MPANPNLRAQLPGYAWDRRLGNGSGRYREVLADGRLGRIVGRDRIVGELRSVAQASATRYANLAADAVGGRLSPAYFQEAMRAELRNLYNATSALARGGWSQMDAAAWGANGQILKGEYSYLAGFAQDIADGKLSEAQAMARAELYAGKAYSRYWAEDRDMKIAAGYTEEQWLDTSDDRECGDCVALARRGRVPIGSLGTVPGAGDTACLGHCRCEIAFFAAPESEAA
jgi:hypothetical protein